MALQNRYITLYYYAKFEVLCPSLRSPQVEGLCPPTTPLAGIPCTLFLLLFVGLKTCFPLGGREGENKS